MKNYPYDSSILMPLCLGNHDVTFWLEYGIDIKTILLDRRHDIIPVGYGYGKVILGNQEIIMSHPIDRIGLRLATPTKGIILIGHSHRFKTFGRKDNMVIHVPTLSNVAVNSQLNPIPSMIDMTLNISMGTITNIYLQQFILINNQFIKVGECQYDLPITSAKKIEKSPKYPPELKPKLSEKWMNMESLISSEVNICQQPSQISTPISEESTMQDEQEFCNSNFASSTNDYRSMSEVEKFNERYNQTTPKVKELHK